MNAAKSRGSSRDEGAGVALVVGIVAAVLLVTVVSLPVLSAFAGSRSIAAAADAAALAAADTASGALAGVPCEAAQSAAEVNGSRLVECRVEHAIAVVEVSREVAGMHLTARSRAGPPGRR